MKSLNPRYPVATITTKDTRLVERYRALKEHGYNHEEIYIAGLDTLDNNSLRPITSEKMEA